MTCHPKGPPRHPHCAHAHGPTQHDASDGDFADPEALSARLDGPSRDAKEQPGQILAALDLGPAMTVADVGAGTGYFTVRLARAVPEGAVIATDVEPALVRALTERARAEGLFNVRVIQVGPDTTGLEPASVDRILLVGVWHHVLDRVSHARSLSAALHPGGRILIVEAHPDAQHGTPHALRIPPERLLVELRSAGLDARLSSVTLPGRVLIEAHPRD